jgi:hypothetical protein
MDKEIWLIEELDPENQQIRDVYAHFGLAMYLAQSLERGLAMVLALEAQSERMTAWDFDARLAENYGSTFGTLVTKFVASSEPKPAGLTERLLSANCQRNDLAHQYFWDRGIKFCSDEGCMDMLVELRQMQAAFTALDDELGQLADARILQRGQSLESFRQRTELALREMIGGTLEPRNPESVPNPVEVVGAEEWRSDVSKPGNLVLIAKDGRHLAPGQRGLCFGPRSVPSGKTAVALSFDKAFPAIVNPRPKTSSSWNYGIPLENGYILRARTTPDSATNQFFVSIQRTSKRDRPSLKSQD